MGRYKWVPLFGEYEEDGDVIELKGAWVERPADSDSNSESRKVPAVGTILSDQSLAEGRVTAEVTFVDVVSNSACEILLGYNVETGGHICAGIPGYDWSAFAIREWQPGLSEARQDAKWVTLSCSGDRSYIKANRPYDLAVTVTGSNIALAVDGVKVLQSAMRVPLVMPRPVGLWYLNASSIQVKRFMVHANRPKAFVVMHFAKAYDDVYAEVIKSCCDDCGLDTIRADEVYGPGLVINDIVQQILRSQVIIADITPNNPNVYFELGYALACNKPIVLLARRDIQLPFDVSGFRVLFYEDSIAGKARLQEGLCRHLESIMGHQ